ncbi:MAG: hypothetical protein IKT40_01245 [Bacilli bacterium]|nr:hypothetical protein [Bacilli bacterium]
MKKEILAYKNDNIEIIVRYKDENINRVNFFVDIIRKLFNRKLIKGDENVETN